MLIPVLDLNLSEALPDGERIVYLTVEEVQELATPNQSPVVSLGGNQTILLPTTTATLTGSSSDPDGTIVSVLWTIASKPVGSSPALTSPTSNSCGVTGLTLAGAYTFQYKATDNKGAETTGTTTITIVYNKPNVSAGSNQSITLPTSEITLTGSVSPGSYAVATTTWSKVSGASNPTLTPTGAAGVIITGLTSTGAHVFKLTGTDVNGQYSESTVTVTVNAAPKVVKFGYFDSDPMAMAFPLAGLQHQMNITTGQGYTCAFNSSAIGKFLAIEEDSTEPEKNNWYNTALNNGTFGDGDPVFRDPYVYVAGAKRYYITWDYTILDSTNTNLQVS